MCNRPLLAELVVATLLVCGFARESLAQLTRSVHAFGFSQPIAFVQDPTNAFVQLVVHQGGRIRVISRLVTQSADFLDLSSVISTGGERGLLGFAFAPDYAISGRFYVNFTNLAGHTVIERFRRSTNPLIADASSRFDLRWGGSGGAAFIAQPYANHNGGDLEFGPDEMLYVTLGDGGSANDPQRRASDTFDLLGKTRHEPLKRDAELCRVELAEQSAERVMAGQTIGQLEEAAQERLLRLRKQRHVPSPLATAQHRAQGDHQ